MPSVAVGSQDHIDTHQGDEIHKYVNSWFVTASKACWRIFQFDIHARQPTLQCLAIHKKTARQSYLMKLTQKKHNTFGMA